jgi:pyruvate,orthophosphate dikinase
MKGVLGSKGANLAEMTNLGVPVPPGFTIACSACMEYLATGGVPAPLREEVAQNLKRLEEATGKRLGDPANPLLVSVRSGAAISMPGMMETVLNLGLSDETVEGLAALSGNGRFAWDAYRRFLQMYGDVVLNVPASSFEAMLTSKRLLARVESDSEIPESALRALTAEYKALVRSVTGSDFPMDPAAQLWGAIEAVWRSWTLKKAVDYRKVNGIPTISARASALSPWSSATWGDSGTEWRSRVIRPTENGGFMVSSW